jgi:glutamine cyclotransferase
MKKIVPAFVFFSVVISTGCTNNDNPPTPPPPPTPSRAYSVVATHPHDTSSFTEGLEFYKGMLIESTGLKEKSKLIQYDLQTGKADKQLELEDRFFGEGVTVFRDTAYQLTYQESTVHVYDAKTFKKIKELPFTGEGWGLTHDSAALIATNGSNNLYFYEPGTMKLLRQTEVNEGGAPAVNLNEVEFINGYVYANQWQMNYILKIDPVKGEVVAKMDLSSIKKQETEQNPKAEVLNGIAYNPETKKFYITGKNWAKIYELQFTL